MARFVHNREAGPAGVRGPVWTRAGCSVPRNPRSAANACGLVVLCGACVGTVFAAFRGVSADSGGEQHCSDDAGAVAVIDSHSSGDNVGIHDAGYTSDRIFRFGTASAEWVAFGGQDRGTVRAVENRGGGWTGAGVDLGE